MFPENLNRLPKRQKNKDLQGVTASNTRGWRGWADPTSLLRIHALISRRCDIHLHNVFGCVPPFTHSALKRAVLLMMPAVRRRLHMDPHGSNMHLSKTKSIG